MTRSQFTRHLLSVVVALALSACDSGDARPTDSPRKLEAAAPKPVVDPQPAPIIKPAEAAPAPDTPAGKVQIAAAIAREISAAPEQADAILDRHGLDRDEFDVMMFEIAGDPDLTKAYMAARRTR